MTAHAAVAGFGFLEFFVQEEHLFQEGSCGNDGADDAGEFVVLFRIVLGDEGIDGPVLRGFVHGQAADFHLDARRDVAFGLFQHGGVMDQQDRRVSVAVDMDGTVFGLALSNCFDAVACDAHFLKAGIQFVFEGGDDVGPSLAAEIVALEFVGSLHPEEGVIQSNVDVFTESLDDVPALGKAGAALLCAVKDYV